MSHTIPAVLSDGVFRPLKTVDWPDGTRAEVIPLPQPTPLAPTPSEAWPAGYFEQTAGAPVGEEFLGCRDTLQ